jgi:sec-independent protein translocase protein TatA
MTALFSLLTLPLPDLALSEGEVVKAFQLWGLGLGEILIIMAIFMLIFGARKLPEIGRGLGRAIVNFKRGIKEEPQLLDDVDEEVDEDEEENSKTTKEKKKKKRK